MNLLKALMSNGRVMILPERKVCMAITSEDIYNSLTALAGVMVNELFEHKCENINDYEAQLREIQKQHDEMTKTETPATKTYLVYEVETRANAFLVKAGSEDEAGRLLEDNCWDADLPEIERLEGYDKHIESRTEVDGEWKR